jgi:hypothetical protein
MTRQDGFKRFIANLATNIEKHEQNGFIEDESRLERQYRQLRLLIGLEKTFRKTLIKHYRGAQTYKKFVQHILREKRNILAARPYFRERQQVFSREISNALKKGADKGLYKFHFNYTFVAFVLGAWDWAPKSPIVKLAKKIEAIRQEITEMNMPLALSQTRAFWENTPRSHLSYMDLVQIHALGLLVAVDKFVPPSTKGMTREEELQAYRSFRAVAIGRMMGDRIEQYSETVIHYYPSDKRKLYRAHKALRITGTEGIDYDKLVETVNDGLDEPSKTNPDEMAELLASAAMMSGDVVLEPDGETILERHPSTSVTAETRFAEAEAMAKMRFACQTKLSVVEKKLLQLRGVSL